MSSRLCWRLYYCKFLPFPPSQRKSRMVFLSFLHLQRSRKLGKTPWFRAQRGVSFQLVLEETKQRGFAHKVVLLLCSKNRPSPSGAGRSRPVSPGLCWKAEFLDLTLVGLLELLVPRYIYFLTKKTYFVSEVLFISHLTRECFCLH